MAPDTVLKLGDFEFARYEVPDEISFGGDHSLIIHKRVGGARTIDAMGADPEPPSWSGTFMGANALDRALYVDGLRKAGQALDLSWDHLSFRVVIRSFHCKFRRFYHLPYSISCEVVSDLTSPVTSIADPDVDLLIEQDMSTANGISEVIADSTLSSLMGAVNSAISAVGSFANATQSTLNTVLQPLAAARGQVVSLLTVASTTIQGAPSLGGIVPGNTIAQQETSLQVQIDAMGQSPQLINLDCTLGRVEANVGSVGSGVRQVSVTGGDLYSLAAQYLGDPMAWPALAAANGLSDPQLSGLTTLIIPPISTTPGTGILNA
jgi:hypothetical protein